LVILVTQESAPDGPALLLSGQTPWMVMTTASGGRASAGESCGCGVAAGGRGLGAAGGALCPAGTAACARASAVAPARAKVRRILII